ncbi:MAG TPA: DUF2332 family protein [Solirubrobacterales bacterium]|nr:DUF2332 family protein [Solirubrobacterales bacterium]
MVELPARLRTQAGHCDRLGSPFYAGLLERAAADIEVGGPVAQILRGHEEDPPESMLALRLMGAVRRRVLEGALPDMEWSTFRRALVDDAESIRSLLDRPVQTNEVGRCAALLPGFLAVARETGLPLRLLEIGASAGLNLRWDRRLRAALELAAEVPVSVDRARAADWAAVQLSAPRPGVATVVFHSIVMQYLPSAERREFEYAVRAAGEVATDNAPLAWLRMEPAGDQAEVRLARWPGGEDRLVARVGYHGDPVRLSP